MAVVWDPSIGRYRDTQSGQLATTAAMQAAGVAPRSTGGRGGGTSTNWMTDFIQGAKKTLIDMNPITRIFNGLKSAGGWLIQSFAKLATFIGGTVVAALTALVAAVTSTVRAAMEMARNLALIRANSGRSFTQGYKVTNSLAAFGVSAADVASGTKDPVWLTRMRAGALGGASIDDGPLAMARSYQRTRNSGLLGPQMANSALDAQFGGSAPDSVKLMVNLPLDKIQGQLGFNQKVQNSLGINPEVLKSYAEDVPLLIGRIGMLWDAIKMRFAVQILPTVERVLGNVTEFLSKNFDKIAEGMKAGVTWLVADLPPLLMHFVANVLRAFAWLLTGFSNFTDMLAKNLPAILSSLDVMLNGLRAFGKVVTQVAAVIMQGVSGLVNPGGGGAGSTAGNFVRGVGRFVGPKIGIDTDPDSPFGDTAATGVGIGTSLLVGNTILGGVKKAGVQGISRVVKGAANAAKGGIWSGIQNFGMRALAQVTGTAGTAVGGPGLALPGWATNVVSGVGRLALAHPVVSGVVAGIGGYEYARRKGWLGKDAEDTSAWQSLKNIWGRGKALVTTGDWSNYDKGLNEQWQREAEEKAKKDAETAAAVKSDPFGAILPQAGRSWADAWTQSGMGYEQLMPRSNLAGDPALTKLIQQWSANASGKAGQGADLLNGWADSVDAAGDNWKQESLKLLQGINDGTAKTNALLDEGNRTAEMSLAQQVYMAQNMLARIASNLIQDEAMMQTRVSG